MKELVPASGLAAWRALRKAHTAAISQIEADLENHDRVPLTWYDVLVAISTAPDARLRMGEVADVLLLTRSNATRLVDRLQAAGLIERGPAEDDGRGSVARLTAAGRQALRKAWPIYAAGINRYFVELLKRKELEIVADSLSRVESRTKALPRRRQPVPS